jgi:hypothetical protein
MDKEFSTPFDDKGRCHHHPNIQMASKKFGGGWNTLMTACPRCIEAKYEEEAVIETSSNRGGSRSRSRGSRYNRDDDDNESTTSGSTKQSVTSRTKPVTLSGKFDKNGCCTMHPNLQVAKKSLLGRWKEFRSCPKCFDPNYDDRADNDAASVSSRHSKAASVRSTTSKKSTRSVKSNSSRRGGKKTDRFGALPFDGEGYCHAHPSVRLAKKKALGGWKVLHDMCPDCAQDASSQCGGSVRSKSSRRSSKGTGRYFDDSASETSSKQSGKSSGSGRKKKIRVKDMRYEDENGKVGKYSGDVNDEHQPHGQGKMKYKDGSVWEGVWSEGSQAHGKTTTSSKSGSSSRTSGSSSSKVASSSSDAKSGGKKTKSSSSSSDWARRDPVAAAESNTGTSGANTSSSSSGGSKKVVRKMKWMDYYGDPGEYTGEVDKASMPNGKGVMKYDHGLVQEGMWQKGQFVEGSDVHNHGDENVEKKSAKESSSKKSSGAAAGGNEKSSSRSSRPSSSSKSSSGKRDP